MPMYVYQCDKCGLTFERKQAVTEAPLSDCPECDGRVRRVIQPVGVLFKGSGWYITDHRPKNADGGAANHSNDKGKDKEKDKTPPPPPSSTAAASGSSDSSSTSTASSTD